MKTAERKTDQTAWEMSRVDAAGEPDGLTDEILQAYRSGDLPGDRALAVEQALSLSPRARARLAHLAGVRTLAPPPSVRARLFGPKMSFQWQRLAAAVAVLALGGLLYLQIGERTDPGAGFPAGFAGFDVRVEGLALDRGQSGAADAYPDTTVRITLESGDAVPVGLEYAVYGESADSLVRLDGAGAVTLEVYRGAARVVAPAAALVGDTPGVHTVYLTVAPDGVLPDRWRLKAGQTALETLSDAGRMVYPVRVNVLPPP